MEYRAPKPTHAEGVLCCEIPCSQPADYEITLGPTYEDVTHACKAHVAALIGDGVAESITPIITGRPAVDTLDVVFDGPPGPVSGRFVELEGFYGWEPGTLGPQGVGGPEWVQDGDFWRLRIHIWAGQLVG